MATEARKTVSVFFCDVTGSTELGERLDPESQRRVMTRYFETVSKALIAHGGSVEKFIGDAVMAVFGIPQLHEDDALRAVRAAAEARDELAKLNDELERDRGVRIQVRMGVNTGEVVAGDPTAGQNLVTGDAVNVAARLEQAAPPGEILIGAETHRLVRDAVRVEPVDALELKGKAERVPAYRLVEAPRDTPAFLRKLDAPFVGRELELRLLEREFERALADRSCRLVTLIGPAGIGKSRLVLELTHLLRKRAKTLVGHCLPYGEGITYWPLVEVVKQLGGGGDARSTTTALFVPSEEALLIAERIAGAVGQIDAPGATEEIFWAVRKLLETLAKGRPLIVVLDDLHWAEPTFLDLVEYLHGFSTDAPILLLCVARPELLDARPSWSVPRPNATTVVLEPLVGSEAEALVGTDVPLEERARILEAAEGNPLFVEQMLALRAENGNGGAVPPTIQALLAARIDRLDAEEREVIERASVEGRVFHRGAVAELTPEELRPRTSTHLLTLVRKELIRPGQAEFAGEDAFRFAHILVRDAAYAAMPKELRANLHERYASWLERQAGDRIREYGDIVGFHLEHAYSYRNELGSVDERTRELGRRGGELLAAAGERATARYDMRAATRLLERALALLPDEHSARLVLRLQLAEAVAETGHLPRAAGILEELVRDAEHAQDAKTAWQARIALARAQIMSAELAPDEAAALAQEATVALERLGDDAGLARAWRLMADTRNLGGDTVGLEDAIREALTHARRAGDLQLETDLVMWLGVTAFFGPTPLDRVDPALRELEQAATPLQRAHARLWIGALQMLRGDPDGLEAVVEARRTLAEFGLTVVHAATSVAHAALELLRGETDAAEHVLREAADELEQAGDKGYRSTVLATVATIAARDGRTAEAERLVDECEAITMPEDLVTSAYTNGVRALLAARRGSAGEVEQAARRAIVAAGKTDSPFSRTDIYLLVAEAFQLIGNAVDAQEAAVRARAEWERKGVPAGVAQADAFLAQLVPA